MQTRLPLQRVPDFSRGGFIVSPANETALAAIESWPRWLGGKLVVVGPAHSGKSHLAAIWARTAEAELLRPDDDLSLRRAPAFVIEDADRRPADETMFHALNAAEQGATILLTARTQPREWKSDLADLRSRLNALWAVELAMPDDAVLIGLLDKFFRERNIRPEPDVVPYLLRRIERSAAAAFGIVARVDEAADAERRGVTRAFVRGVLDRAEANHDLSD